MEVADEIIMMPIDRIIPYDKNPRKNSKTVELLIKVLPKVGFNVPLVLDTENVIVKGHARYLAAKALGMTELPCIISHADPELIKADRIADNKVFEFSRWIHEELMHELDILDIGIDLSEFGLETAVATDDFSFEDEEEDEIDDAELQERKRRFLEMIEQQQQAPVEITSHKEIENAKREQSSEVKAPPNYFSVQCENCGHTIYVREGDFVSWE